MNWSDLIVHAEPWQGAVLGAGCLILTALLYGWGSDRPKPTWLLALLRMASLGVLALLLLEPMVRRNTETVERPLLPVLVDQSSSQWTGADSLDRREALATLVNALPTWTETEGWDMALLGFDRDVVELSPEGWQADGKRTDLGGALETVRSRFVHRNVPAVVVVTDGRVNRGPDPEYSARKLDVPHVFVGTGDTAVVKDLDLTDLRMNEVAYLGNAFPVEVTVRSRGFQDVPLSVQLTSNGQILDSKPWTPSQDLASTTWTTQLDADKAGVRTVTARIRVQGGASASEATTANNSRTRPLKCWKAVGKSCLWRRRPTQIWLPFAPPLKPTSTKKRTWCGCRTTWLPTFPSTTSWCSTTSTRWNGPEIGPTMCNAVLPFGCWGTPTAPGETGAWDASASRSTPRTSSPRPRGT